MAQLFRKSSIEKLSSPDQLDKAVVVTSPMSWIALAGVAFIIVCFMIWAFLGTMPSTIGARGIISNGIYTNSLYSEYSGTVSEICVSEGDTAEVGDIVCKVTDESGEVRSVCARESCVITKQLVDCGDSVGFSDAVFGVSPISSGDRFVVFYIGTDRLPGIRTGMEAIINLPGFDNQKYGHMIGTVVNIDTFASSEDSVRRVTGSEKAARELIGEGNVPVAAVTCVIRKDASSQNGLFWSSRAGTELAVPVGSIVDVKLVTGESAPVSKLFPVSGN